MSKFIDTTPIVDPNTRLPVAAKTLNWLQTAPREDVAALIIGLSGYTANEVLVLTGCVVTYAGPTGGTASVTAGYIYYNGLIYAVRANGSLVIGTGQIPVWITGTVNDQTGSGGTGNDPTEFTNGSNQNVHLTNLFILASGPAGGSGVANYAADYNDVVNLPATQQSDWNEATTTNADYIKNKPANGADWDAVSGFMQILNKPSVPVITITKGTTSSIVPSAGTGPITVVWQKENVNGNKKFIFSFIGAFGAPNSTVVTMDFTTILGGDTFDGTNSMITAFSNYDNTGTPKQIGGHITLSGSTVTFNSEDGFNSGDNYNISGQCIALLT